MKRLAFLGILAALLLGGLLLINHRRKQSPIYLLRHYPQSANFDYVIERHWHNPERNLFLSDWFFNGTTNSAMGCSVENVTNAEVCTVYSGSMTQSAGLSAISPARLARFQTALRALPPGESVAPPLNRLLIVSFHDGSQWTTRIYDRAHPPDQLVQLVKVAGFRGLRLADTDAAVVK